MYAKIHAYVNTIPASWILTIGLLITLAIAVTMTREFRQKYLKEWFGRAVGVVIVPTSSWAFPDYIQRDTELRGPMKLIEFSRYSIVEEDIASLSYMSRLNECFDMPFSELARCPNAFDD